MIKVLFRFRILLFIVYVAAFSYGLFSSNLSPSAAGADKLMHIVAFFGLGLVSKMVFIYSSEFRLWSFLFLLTPALEYFQPIIEPQRVFNFLDIAANFCGVLLALIIWLLIKKRVFISLETPSPISKN